MTAEGEVLGLSVTERKKYYHRQIFSDKEEILLKEYLLKSSKIHYGLAYIQTRKLAFDYAMRLEKVIPKSWKINESAGVDWMKCFMRRHPNLSLRKPENTSLARTVSFNKTNAKEFLDNYTEVMQRYNFQPAQIFNLDETGITTVMPSPKVNSTFFLDLAQSNSINFLFLGYCRDRKKASRTNGFGRTWRVGYVLWNYKCDWRLFTNCFCISTNPILRSFH